MMHPYKIVLTEYTAEGAPTANVSRVYADTPEEFNELYKSYKAQKYENGFARYKVEPLVSGWNAVSMEDFRALYHLD